MDTDKHARSFSVPDFIVFGLLVFTSVTIGIFFAFRDKKRNTSENYFLGNRKLRSLPVGLSFVVTFQSSILILGFPAEAYAYGLQYAMQCVGVFCGYLLAALIVVPIFHPLKVTSVYEYYYIRYKTNSVRYVAVTLGIIHYTFYMGIVMYGTALALESVAKLPMWSSILILSTSAVIYTSIGGFKAVIWTDIFQALTMLVGILAVLIKSTKDAGGVSNVFQLSKSRLNLFNFDPDPTIRHTFWTLCIGATSQFLYLSITQAGVQRINSTPSIGEARKLFYIAAPIYSFTWVLVMIQGLAIFAYFSNKRCDPLASGQIENLNQIIPFSMLELFHDYPGLPGLFIAALAAASLSTISSGLCCLSAVTYQDFIKVFFTNVSEEKGTNISKAIVALYGLISVGFACLLSNVEGPLSQILSGFMGAVAGPEAGLFLISVFFRRAQPKAVIIGTLASICLVLWLTMGQNFSATLPKTPYLSLGPIDHCLVSEMNNISLATYQSAQSQTNLSKIVTNMTLLHNNSTSFTRSVRTGLETFYSISYMYFHLIGCILVIPFSIIISLLTQRKDPQSVSEKTVLPFSIFVPLCLKNRWYTYNSDSDTNSTKSEQREGMYQIECIQEPRDDKAL